MQYFTFVRKFIESLNYALCNTNIYTIQSSNLYSRTQRITISYQYYATYEFVEREDILFFK